MRRRSYLVVACGLALGWCFSSAREGRADDFAVLVDEHGHKIYINDAPRRPTGLRNQGLRAALATGHSGQAQGVPLQGLSSAPEAPAPDFSRLVEQSAGRFQVDPELVHAIIRVESDYNPRAVSRKGAVGLMQLIPATARRFGVKNAFDPKENIEGGVNYLRYLLDLFGDDLPLSIAAYNAGENAVLRSGGIPAFSETRNYVRRVTGLYGTDSPGGSKQNRKGPYKDPIRRYVDANGVIHFTNVD